MYKCLYVTAGKREFVEGIDISTDITFTSACGYPTYTNYVPAFSGCLDYIYIDSKLKCERVIPLPSHDVVTQHTALPNRHFPSDHLPLVCDITWSQERTTSHTQEPPQKRNKLSWLSSVFGLK